jgi:hypothetical protein
MTPAEPRTGETRKADTLARLGAVGADVWVASADGAPYLVPLSLAWIDGRVVVAAEVASRTVRNLVASGTARLGLGPTRDVVMIDAVLDRVVAGDAADDGLAGRYADQAGWDPRSATSGDYVYLVLRPERIQAWREADEIPGRTLMRAGSWIV